jgi:hypothetical protein
LGREEESGFIVAKLPDPTNKLAGAGYELYGHKALASIHAEGCQTAFPNLILNQVVLLAHSISSGRFPAQTQ